MGLFDELAHLEFTGLAKAPARACIMAAAFATTTAHSANVLFRQTSKLWQSQLPYHAHASRLRLGAEAAPSIRLAAVR
jgi:hypothetical protein